MTANGELITRLDLTQDQVKILSEFVVYRKGFELVAALSKEGHLYALKKMHTKACSGCNAYIPIDDHHLSDDNAPICYHCYSWHTRLS